jgi:hypothetical protein
MKCELDISPELQEAFDDAVDVPMHTIRQACGFKEPS